MSLHFKLTLFYALVSTCTLALGAAILFAALRGSLYQSFDDSLREAAQLAVSQLGGAENAPHLETEGQRFVASLPGATTLAIFDRQGQVIDRFGDFKRRVALEPGFHNVGEVRAFIKLLPDGGFLQASRSQLELSRTITRSGRLVLLVLPVLLLIGCAAGYALAGRALKPVDQVTRLASQIAASGRYRERVPVAPGGDEMARLTRTVNAMLERLEATIERERAFALSAAHELRSPLAALLGRTSLTLERSREAGAYRAALVEADEIARQMTATADALLTLATSHRSQPLELVDLAELAFDAIELLEPRARARSISVEAALEPAEVHGDAAGLRLSLTNLIENAIKYGCEGGNIWVHSGSGYGRAWCEICDDGPGVPAAELERLRQPFQRGMAVQHLPGAGLGFALVSAVIEAHKGQLELGPASQGGLRVRLELSMQNPGASRG